MSTADDGGAPEPHLWAEANHHRISVAGATYVAHPDGQIRVPRNTLLLGHHGVGKTHAMKALCHEMSQDPSLFPVYIDAERILRRIAAEGAATDDLTRLTPRQQDVKTCAEVTLLLEIVHRVAKYGREISVLPTMRELFGLDGGLDEFRQWREGVSLPVRMCIERGAALPAAFAVPRLDDVVASLADTSIALGRKLILLVDQADRVPPLAFATVLELFQRGKHVTVVATRPSPCAPAAVMNPGPLDYTSVWLGQSGDADAWRAFYFAVIDESPFIPPVVKEIMLERLDDLCSLFVPWVRQLFLLAAEITAILEAQDFDASGVFEAAFKNHILSERSLTASRISSVCNNAERTIVLFQERSLRARESASLGPGRVEFRLEGPGSVNVPPAVQGVLRTFTREGLLIPSADSVRTLDGVADRYEVWPVVACSPDTTVFGSEAVSAPLPVEHLRSMVASEDWDRHRRTSVYICDSQRDPQERTDFENEFIARTGGQLAFTSASSASFAAVLAAVRESAVAVVEAGQMTPRAYLELGASVAANRPWIAISDDEYVPSGVPSWLARYTHTPLSQAMLDVVELVNRGPNSIERWERDVNNVSISPVVNSKILAVVGDAIALEPYIDICRSRAEPDIELRVVALDDVGADSHFDVVRVALQAGTLVTVSSGRAAPDALVLLAQGAFLVREKGKVKIASERTYKRRLLAVLPEGSSRLPDFVRRMNDRVRVCTNAATLGGHVDSSLRVVRESARLAELPPRNARRRR